MQRRHEDGMQEEDEVWKKEGKVGVSSAGMLFNKSL